jgi:glycine cleavage system H protein
MFNKLSIAVNQSNSPGDYYFTEEHEWIRIEGDTAFVGLTTLAKRELGQIDEIEIHTIGKELVENQVFGRIRTKRYLCKLIMPMPGKVIALNNIDYASFNDLTKDFDPQEWIVKLQISLPLKTGKLFTFEQYREHQTQGALHLVKYFLKSRE